jgi:hypothetical protein
MKNAFLFPHQRLNQVNVKTMSFCIAVIYFFYHYIYDVSPAVRLPGDSVIHPSDLNLDQIRSPLQTTGLYVCISGGDGGGCFSFCKLIYLDAFILYYLLQTGLYMAKKANITVWK